MEPDPSLNLVCPICWAQPQERCEMNNGDLRFESHRERQHDPLTTEEDLPVQQSLQPHIDHAVLEQINEFSLKSIPFHST
jgi:hypothetical protein